MPSPIRDIDSLPGDPRFKDLIWEILNLHAKKQADYGAEDDPFANVRSAEEFGVAPWIGALIRLNDKVTRLKNFARKRTLANESAKDSMMDISVYALITIILYQEGGPEEPPSAEPRRERHPNLPLADHKDYKEPYHGPFPPMDKGDPR